MLTFFWTLLLFTLSQSPIKSRLSFVLSFWLFGHPALIDTQYSWRTFSICFIIPSNKSAGIVPWILFSRVGHLFFFKERNVLAFFSILYKRMERSLLSFPFFIKEQNILIGFISHTKIANLSKKEGKRTQRSFYKVKTERFVLFSIYISIYIYIYMLKKERNDLRSFAKERNVLAFFYILCKRNPYLFSRRYPLVS